MWGWKYALKKTPERVFNGGLEQTKLELFAQKLYEELSKAENIILFEEIKNFLKLIS